MVNYVKMPKLTWVMEEGLIAKWLKREGEKVEAGEPLCEIETEKTTDTVESPTPGVVAKILFPERSTVPVGQVLAIIAAPDEAVPSAEEVAQLATLVQVKTISSKVKEEPGLEEAKKKEMLVEERVKISPVARKLAKEHNIDIVNIKGTGPRGRVVRVDIEKAIEEAKLKSMPAAKEGVQIIRLSGMRKIIADRLSRSVRTAVHVPITMEVDMSDAAALHEKLKKEHEGVARITQTDVLVKAVAKALTEYPVMNSIIEGEEIRIIRDVNIGVAVSVEEGLVVPVIHNADRKSLLEIAEKRDDLARKARTGTLTTKEASYGTFTISNLGMYGVDIFAPIMNPPESAILGVGRIGKKPIVIDDHLELKPIMTLTLVFDHRVMDGAFAAQFLRRVKGLLESPSQLLH